MADDVKEFVFMGRVVTLHLAGGATVVAGLAALGRFLAV